jgi:hypothetical protein
MDLEIFISFCSRVVRKSLKGPKKIVWKEIFFCTFLYFGYYHSQLKVGSFINISACRAEVTLHNALIVVLLIFWQGASIFIFPKLSFLKNRLFD